ncbi:phosphatidylinositol-4-phosphate 5-kinase, putative [Plasmodium knowlesi strain H]|uniref:Phosphatidylinositol-4-phosphate 5-kinase, putative n=3 Tax=Plasmodium knowlesi TaxID=5850 RepID=A0A5K1UZH8_PLAKH|nr:uncharacterized protein PKNH_0927600 [Plasmodium knowlesi strain H]OTN64993.1 putative Phosphatidylinositol-4-phosphate 5-kinase [Plasmodium knowlesi]CAA9988323.1 phosphatidylinositol-4-phosphate 5-kinase, putative [Plasmodium knowlesi strain H]SBO20185.1 phosphatidylinositol-4-phosphate 5-kinase, putative [Plasmodium knowlesi strain H]SBO20272.1 phosphatidylinositol-4-phosphate 5-kinase, putative [Plasmodium knowlesi strain H]VVS77797.1 phosphatidylinositol-4-phosphate 5-kinase, putative [|eukprot:XP_002259302.1 [Plasmodium knowlesi strain H]
MGNECSCGEMNSAKAQISNGESNKKLKDVRLCWDEGVGKNILSEDEETEDENYFYRLERKRNMNKSGEKGEHKEEEHLDKWKNLADQMEGEYTINVKKILMYVREYEDDFLLFFKKRNATSLIFLKYIILNYEKYMLSIADTGVVYIGEISPNNEKQGLGVIITPDQCMYIGEFEKDEITGFGLYVHFSKSIYVGHWKGGKTNHYGIFTHTDGTFYKGFWLNDKQNEKGIEHVYANYVFLGNYRKGEKDGFGAFILKNESMYIGHIENNCFSKKGIYFFHRKKMYITNWKQNSIGGACEIMWLDRRQFYGYHSTNNSKEGIGIYKWNDGRIYFGNWANNKQHGYGVFIVIRHIREYERREKAPFFFFFHQTRKIKEYFFLNLLKESFFEKGRVRRELEKAIWGKTIDHYAARGKAFRAASEEASPQDGTPNGMTPQCNNLDAYLFLRTLLCMRYYETCRSYFDRLQKKKCNSFKFNCTFYERVKEHICSVTNRYFNQPAAQERRGYSESPAWSALQGEAGYTRGGDFTRGGDLTSEGTDGTGNDSDDTDEETDDKMDDETDETNGGNGAEIHQGDHPSFEDIERLKNYLSRLNLSHVSEGDITPRGPLFALASRNLVLKLGRWENGKLQEWIYSSDRSRSKGEHIRHQGASPHNKHGGLSNRKKERKNKKKGHMQELASRPCDHSVIDKFLDRMSSSEGSSNGSSDEGIQRNRHTSIHHMRNQKNYEPDDHQQHDQDNNGGHIPFGASRQGKSPGSVPRKGLPRGTSSILQGHKLHGKKKETRSDSSSGDSSGRSSLEMTFSTSNLRDDHQTTPSVVEEEMDVQSSFTDMNSIRKGIGPEGIPTSSILHNGSSIIYEVTKESDKVTLQDRNVNRANRGIIRKGEDDQGDVDRTKEMNVPHALQGENGSSRLEKESNPLEEKNPGGRNRNTSPNDARKGNKSRPHFQGLPEKDEEGILSSVNSRNYDLPKKGFSLVWSLRRMKNSHLSANEHITFEAPKAYVDEEDSQSGICHKKKSFFGKLLRGSRRTGGDAKREK